LNGLQFTSAEEAEPLFSLVGESYLGYPLIFLVFRSLHIASKLKPMDEIGSALYRHAQRTADIRDTYHLLLIKKGKRSHLSETDGQTFSLERLPDIQASENFLEIKIDFMEKLIAIFHSSIKSTR